MHLFLDTYYYHSWTRLIVKGVKSSIDRVKGMFRVDSILFFEDIQLPPKSLPLKLEEKHIERVNSALKTFSDTVYRRVVRGKLKEIDLLKMLNYIGEEHIPLIEYTLIADEYGKVHEESIPQAHTIKVSKELRVKIRRLYRDGLLGVIRIINPLHYREYLILRVSKLLGLPIEKVYTPKPLVKEVSITINEIERHICKGIEVQANCPTIKSGKSIKNHSNDVCLALALAMYIAKKKKFVIVATVPQKWGYFCCSVKYLRRLEGVADKISLLEEVM